FQFRRVYFTYDNDISEQFSSRFRLEADQSARSSDGKISVLVKDAYLRWKNVFRGSDFYFGIQPTPAFGVSENVWGYRSLEKTIMDLRGAVSSRDFGVALTGKIDGAGMFNYTVMVGNGAGNRPETDKYKRYYILIYIKPMTNLHVTLFGDYTDRGNISDLYNTLTPQESVPNGSFTTAAFVGYTEKNLFNVGVEGFLQTRQNGFNDVASLSLKSLNSIGISAFGSVTIHQGVDLVGRFDFFDPNINAKARGDRRNFIIGAIAWRADKNVSFIPNVQIETYSSLPGGRSIEPSITGRLTFYYLFL
ncbi:MAG: hypothetical protein HY708_00225, partial [Ignavibacteriae bacterium]|nr:hypothetical protein [Ignavibacteriota bacterium]